MVNGRIRANGRASADQEAGREDADQVAGRVDVDQEWPFKPKHNKPLNLLLFVVMRSCSQPHKFNQSKSPQLRQSRAKTHQ